MPLPNAARCYLERVLDDAGDWLVLYHKPEGTARRMLRGEARESARARWTEVARIPWDSVDTEAFFAWHHECRMDALYVKVPVPCSPRVVVARALLEVSDVR